MANNEILDAILDIERPVDVALDTANALTKAAEDTEIVVAVPAETSLVPSPEPDVKMSTDFEFARDKMRDLIKKGQAAVDSAIMLAQSGDSPRAYEVVGGMITAIVQANKELINIHQVKAKKEAIQNTYGSAPATAPSEGGGSGVTIERAVFIGKASDLLREIRAITSHKVDSSDVQDEK